MDIESEAKGHLPNDATKYAIRSKSIEGSEVYHRIISTDPDYLMPEPKSHLELNAKEKALLIKWIEDGADYQPHWAFVSPTKSNIPVVNAMSACSGFRPVAKALGAESMTIATLGIGNPLAIVTS